MKAKHLALVGIAGAFLWASTANSATVTIGAAPGAGPLPAPYSVTHLYTIVATGTGAALSTITLATPIPGALPLFAAGLLGLWALGRRRKASPEKVA